MTDPNRSEIIVVLDRSGSMSNIKKDMEGGFDSFIAKQKEVPKDCRVTLVQFDDYIETVYTALPVANVPKLRLEPRGSTALFDALGKTMLDIGSRLRALPEAERPHQVVFLIITDGQENASREFAGHTIQSMTKTQRETFSWEFIYLGANQDAMATAGAMGIHHNAVRYAASSRGAKGLWAAASDGMSSYLSSKQKTSGGIIMQANYDAAVAAIPGDGAAAPLPLVIPTSK
jgi:uncharacterized protein YegL